MFAVEIFFLKFYAVDKYLAASDLNRFARQADDPFYVALIRLFRKPENDDIASFEMAPAYAPDVVVNELVDQQTFAILKLRDHRRSFDHHRLYRKNAKEDEYDEYKKYVARKAQAFGPQSISGLATKMDDVDITVVSDGAGTEFEPFLFLKSEH